MPCSALALFAVAFSSPALAQHPGQNDPPPAVAQSAETRIADIVVFREQFLAGDRAYSAAARAEAERRLTALKIQAGSVSQVYFEL
jgi:hypothetical protein